MAKTTREEAEAVLAGDDRRRLYEVLKALPADVDPKLGALGALRYLGDSSWGFARACRNLPLPVIEAIVEELPNQRSQMATFLQAYLPGQAELAVAWKRALTAVLDLDSSYPWNSHQRRAKFAALARDPLFVSALQATAVGWEQVRPDLLAVLTIEASDASLDALMPHFERAARDQGHGLDRLQQLKTHATLTPAMKQLFARVDAMLASRHAASPALELARQLGFEGLTTFWFSIYVNSVQRSPIGLSAAQVSLRVDNRHLDWFSVSAWHDAASYRSTYFSAQKTHRDELAAGTCGPALLPAWIAGLAPKLEITWDVDSVSARTHLKGKNRARLVSWFTGG